jgi:uncharacterized low-complexity protein
MSTPRTSLALLVGAAVASGSLFSMQALAHGYMQDAGKAQAAEGKCGEGKCAAAMPGKADHEGGCGMAVMDTDKDGRISRAEFAARHHGDTSMFAKIDSNGDGFISQSEMDAHHAAMKKPAAGAKATSEGKCGEGKCGEGMCGSM